MQNTILSMVMDLLMAGLLLATIIYCLKLNGRIKVLQDSKSELARIIREFDESTQRATESIEELHKAASRINENMQHKIDKANYLANDLEYMIERGNKLAGKTDEVPVRSSITPEAAAATMRAATPPVAPASLETAAPAEAQATGGRRPLRMRSRAEQELMTALGNKNTDESGR